MLNTFKRGIAAMLSLILLIGAVQLPVFATTENGEANQAAEIITSEDVMPEAETAETVSDDAMVASVPEYLREIQVAPGYKPPKRGSLPDLTAYKKDFVKQALSGATEIDVAKYNFPNTDEILDYIIKEIYYETPEAFVKGFDSYHYSNGKITKLVPTYADFADTPAEYATSHATMVAAADTILEGIEGNANLSTVEKALLLHDRLALWTAYDETWDPNNIIDSNQSAYGPLGLQIGVCQGYAMAYMYMMERVGIRVDYCSSSALKHAWNIVYIGDTPYHVDVTWDDPILDHRGRVYHDNFLRSSKGMIETGHSASGYVDYDQTPVDTSCDNAYWKSSYAAFQYVNGNFYYINNVEGIIYVSSSGLRIGSALLTLTGDFGYGSNGGFKSELARLGSVGCKLLFNAPKSVMEYDLSTGISKAVVTPSLYGSNYIYGFKYENGKIHYEISSTDNYTSRLTARATAYSPACSHSFTEYVSNNNATCLKNATETAKCDYCDVTNTRDIPNSAKGHKWNSGVYTKPTLEADGYTTYTCTTCGKTKVVTNEGSQITIAVITKQPTAVTTDSGTNVQFSVEVDGEVVSYKWQYRKVYKWFDTSMTGYNTNTLKVTATGARNGYDYRCVITFKNGVVLTTDPAKLTVRTYITVTKNPEDQIIALGSKAKFTAAATGEGIKYQWQYQRPDGDKWNDTAMEGATKATVMIETTSSRDGYKYRCKITDVTGNVVYTQPATMSVLYIKAHPVAVTVESGETAYFMVIVSVQDITFQWQYTKDGVSWSNTSLTGYNAGELVIEDTKGKNGYQYRCVITDARNNKLISNSAKLTVKTQPADPAVIKTQPKSATALTGGSAEFSVKATGVSAYKWYFSKDGNTWNETKLEGYNTDTLIVDNTKGKNNYQYRCTLTGKDGIKVNSNAATLKVAQITQQPASVYAFENGKAQFSTKLSVDGGITRQWQYRISATGTWRNTDMTGFDKITLTAETLSNRDGYEYSCLLTDSFGNTLRSEPAVLNLLKITGQPASVSVVPDGKATISVGVSQPSAVSYEWQYKRSETGNWTKTSMTGYNTAKLTLEAKADRNAYEYRCQLTDSEGNKAYTEAAVLRIPFITQHPVDVTTVDGQIASFLVVFGNMPEDITYQWQYSADGVKWSYTSMEGYQTGTLDVAATAARDGYLYRCILTDKMKNQAYSDVATLRVLAVKNQPANVTAKAGDQVTFTVAATFTENLTYRWEYSTKGTKWNKTTMTGYDTPTLQVAATAGRSGYQYRCVITDKDGNQVISNAATLYVPTITKQPVSTTVMEGQTATFKVTTNISEGVAYKWEYSTDGVSWKETGMTGYNTATLEVDAIASRNGYLYRCVVTDAKGNKLISDSAVLTVEVEIPDPAVITTQPKNTTALTGGKAVFEVEATGAVAFKWEYRKTATGSWTDTKLTGYKTQQLTVDNTKGKNGYQYRCVITGEDGVEVISDPATLTVTQLTADPENKCAFVDGIAKFSVKLSVEGGVTFRWQYRKSATTSWIDTKMTGYNKMTLLVTATAARNGYEYRCVITDSFGNVLESEPAILTTVKILQQPTGQTTVTGGKALFTVTASLPDAVKYQWQYRTGETGNWTNTTMEGYNTANLAVEATTKRDGYEYRCQLTDGEGNKVYTEPAALQVMSITSQPASVTATEGETVTFIVASSLIEGVTYQWQYSKNGTNWYTTTMPGAQTATLLVEAKQDRNGYQYRCVVKDINGYELISEAATLTVEAKRNPANITSQPEKAVAFVDGNAKFTVKATGVTAYQWQYRRSETANWMSTSMEGCNTDTLIVGATAARQGYQYRCVLTGEDGAKVYSDAAALVLSQITQQPSTGYGFIGSITKFTVQLSDTTGIKYQWQYRRSETANWTNTTMTGYNNKTLTVAVTAARNGYQYRCNLTDSFGNVLESEGAALSIVKITQQPADQTASVNSAVEFSVATTNPEIMGYQWQYRRSETGNWTNTTMDGYNTDLLCVEVTAGRNGYQYRCILKLANGSTLESDIATLTVQ